MTYITEEIPDLSTLPLWAQEAFNKGQFFLATFNKIKEYEKTIEKLKRKIAPYSSPKEDPIFSSPTDEIIL